MTFREFNFAMIRDGILGKLLPLEIKRSFPRLSLEDGKLCAAFIAVSYTHLSIAYALDEPQKQQARKELQLSEQEDILFYMACPHDGTVTYCALTESGLYLKGTIMTGKIRHVSWTEFVQIQWGTPNFLTILKLSLIHICWAERCGIRFAADRLQGRSCLPDSCPVRPAAPPPLCA